MTANARAIVVTFTVVSSLLTTLSPAKAASRDTESCRGSFDKVLKYRQDKKGAFKYFDVRNTSCRAGRKLMEAGKYARRNDSGITVVAVPNGSTWKCRSYSRVVSEAGATIEVGLSCRAVTGRSGRRVTLRTGPIQISGS